MDDPLSVRLLIYVVFAVSFVMVVYAVYFSFFPDGTLLPKRQLPHKLSSDDIREAVFLEMEDAQDSERARPKVEEPVEPEDEDAL